MKKEPSGRTVFNFWLKAVWEPQHGHPIRGILRTTYIDTIKADSGLNNTKEIRDVTLDQVVWKDFVRMAQNDSRPEKAYKHISTFQSERYAGCLLYKPGLVSLTRRSPTFSLTSHLG